jgi:aspartyl protease family protein
MRDNHGNNGERRPIGWIYALLLVVCAGVVAALWSALPPGAELDFVKLMLIGLFVGAGVVCGLRRVPLGRSLRYAAIWLIIGGVIFVGYSFRDEARYVLDRVSGDLVPERGYGATETEISFRAGPNGHFLVEALVEGRAIHFVVDTGASDVILTREDARILGYDPDALVYSLPYNTANGTVMGAPLRLERLEIGPIVVRDVRASVNRMHMEHSLLGNSFLSELAGYKVSGDVLTLYAPQR